MPYVEVAPPAEAAAIVRALWSSEPDATPGEPALVLPDGSADIIFVDGAPRLVGVMTKARRPSSGARPVFGLRLHPWAAHLVTHGQARRFTDRVVSLDQVNRPLCNALATVRSMNDLRDACAQRSWRSSLHGSAGEFVAAADPHPVRAAVAGLELHPSARLRDLLPGSSERHARRVFVEQVGLSPKAFARIARLQQALRLSGDHARLVDLAAAAGYADQAHFSREARALTGMTASALAAVARQTVT